MKTLILDKPALSRPLFGTIISCLLLIFCSVFSHLSHAETAREIDTSVDVALERFYKEVKGAEEFLRTAKGVLIFPSVYKAGFVFGQKGLMANLTFEGSKYTKLDKTNDQ